MMRSIVVFSFAALVLASTYAQESDILPEDSFAVEGIPDMHDEQGRNLDFAQRASKLGDSKCKELAKDLKEEVDTGVKTDQKELDMLSDHKCDNEGVANVKAAEAQLTKSIRQHNVATTEKTSALTAKVSFASINFGSLKVGDCNSQFFEQSSYTSAHARVTKATTEVTRLEGVVTEAKVAVANAKAEAAKQQHACRCRMKKLQLEVFEKLSKNNASRKEAYGKANMLLCVLAKKDTKDVSCTAHDLPTLKMPQGVHNDKCVAYIAKGITKDCPHMCGESQVTLQGSVACVGIRGKTEPLAKCENAKLVKPAVESKNCPPTNPCGAWTITKRDTKTDCPKAKNPCVLQPEKTLLGSVRCVCSAGVCSDKHCRSAKPAIPKFECPRLGKGSAECKEQERKIEVAQKAVAEKATKTKEIAHKKAETKKQEEAEKAALKEKADKNEKKDKHLKEVADKKEKATKVAEKAGKKKEKDAKERNTKAEQATKAAEKKDKVEKAEKEKAVKLKEGHTKAAEKKIKEEKAAKERNTKAAEQATKKNQAIVAAQIAAKKAVETSNELKVKACGVREWKTNSWYAWTDCCQGCDGRSPAPGGLRGACIHRQKYNWGKDRSVCTCRAQPKGVRDFQTNRYYFNTDCCAGCKAAQSTCIRRHPGAAWTSTCTCRMSC